jgi:hypothetical protein
MSDPTRLDTNPDPRTKLRDALTALAAEKQNLDSLEQARTRAMESSWDLATKQRDAEADLRQAKAHEPTRLALAYASGERDTISPVEISQANLDQAQAAYRQIEVVEDALTQEIVVATSRLQRSQTQVHVALSELVCSSTEFHQLFDELTQAWARLRGIRKAFAQIQRELHGQMPSQYEKWQNTISLDPQAVRDSVGPIPTDDTLVQAWQDALARLLDDPNAPLPEQV